MPSSNASSRGEVHPLPTVWLAVMFAIAAALIVSMFSNFPPLEQEQRDKIKLPSNLEELRDMAAVLSLYTESYYFTVVSGFSITYVFLQTFSIPGSIFLSFLGGALFGPWMGVLLVALLSTVGASLAYILSFYSGRTLVLHFFPNKLELFAEEVEKRRSLLFNYLLFLRLTPLLPNWFINIASPIVGVPLHIFAIATFFGVMPQTFVAVKAGMTLQNLKQLSDVIDLKVLATFFALGLLSLLPTWKPVRDKLDRLLLREMTPEKKAH